LHFGLVKGRQLFSLVFGLFVNLLLFLSLLDFMTETLFSRDQNRVIMMKVAFESMA